MTYRPPILIKGNTQLIHELHPVEQAAGLSTAWLGDDLGALWRAKGRLPKESNAARPETISPPGDSVNSPHRQVEGRAKAGPSKRSEKRDAGLGEIPGAYFNMPDDDEAGRLPRRVAYPLIVMLSLAIWVGIIGLCFWAAP